ncbi:uncharacterized protein rab44 isoform X2 [Hippocampus comes]|uniref:uncharacterized protein rab44 isoform X2 n=1 Tax=Hippocampus comes TaxID=109280 RepID=UPI00094EFC9B|nr:PREDICTED: uncharacterized protein LOC109531442 isoform X2 [Hippocampus comes]
MPGPSGKKRLGSRRRVPTQVEMPEDLTAANQSSQPEESGEPFSELSNEGDTPLVTHGMLSSQQKSGRRKLGSNRRTKRNDSEQSATESCHKPTKEVEQNVHTEKEAEMTRAVRDRAFCEVNDDDSVYGANSYSADTPGRALDPGYWDSDVGRHKPIREKLYLDDGARDGDCKWDVGHDKQVEDAGQQWSVKQKLHDPPTFTGMSARRLSIDAEKEALNEYPLQPTAASQGDHLNIQLNEIDVAGNPERPPEESCWSENVESKYSVEQVNYSPAIGEVPSNEEHEPFDFPQVKPDQLADQNEIEEIKSLESDQKYYPEIGACVDKEAIDKCLEDRKEEVAQRDAFSHSVKSLPDSCLNPHQEELLKEKTVVLYQGDHCHAPETDEALINIKRMETTPCQAKEVNNQVKAKLEQSTNGVLTTMTDCALPSQSVQPESGFVFDSPSPDNHANTHEQRESFSPHRNRRKLGSSRRSKRSHEMVNAAETNSDSQDDAPGKTSNDGDEPPKMEEATSTIEAVEQKKMQLNEMDNLDTFLSEDMHQLVEENAHSNSTVPQPRTRLSNYEEIPKDVLPIDKAKTKATDENQTLLQDGNLGDILEISMPKTSFHEDTEIEYSAAIAAISSPKAKISADEHEHFGFSQVGEAQHPDEDLIGKAKLLETDQTKDSKTLVKGLSGDVHTNVHNLVESGLNPQDEAEKQLMEDNTEVLEQRDENNVASNTAETWIITEKTHPTQSREQKLVFDSQSEDSIASADQQKDSFSQDTSRTKLGSSRCVKRSKINADFKDEAVGETRDDYNQPGDLKEATIKIETAELEKSELQEMGNSITFQAEPMIDLVRENDQAGFSEFMTSNTHSNTTVPELLIERSSSREMSEEEELPIGEFKTKAEEENETSPQNENVHDEDLVSQALVDADVSVATPEVSTPKSGLDNDADIECNEAKATISSPKAETSTDEHREHFGFSQVREARYTDVILTKSSEMDQHEDCEILSPARNRRTLGSSRRNKGTLRKDSAAETYNESPDSAAGNDNDKADPPVTKDMTFTIESAEMGNTEKNSHDEDADSECRPSNATISLPKEEMEDKRELASISGGYHTQHFENVNPVEGSNELNHVDDSAVQEICSTAGVMPTEASADCEEFIMDGPQYTRDKTLPVAAEPAGQQVSQHHTKAIFKATEKMVVEVVKSQVIREQDSIPPNADKNESASSQGEVPDIPFISHQHTNVCSASSLNVQQSEETFQEKSMEAVSFQESLEDILEAANDAQEKAVEERRHHSDATGRSNVTLTPPKKRKMGSTRRSRMNGKHTVEMDRETDTGALENDDVLTDVPQTEAFQRAEEEQDFNTTEADPKLHNSPRESNLISATSDVITVSPEQVSPHDTSHVADARSDRDTIACTETFEPDYVPVLVDTESKNKHQLLSNKCALDSEATKQDVNVVQGQNATELPGNELMVEQSNIPSIKTESERAPDRHLKSPGLNSTSKKRKMGSTRRNLGTKSKGDLELKLDLNREVPVTALVQNVMTERACQSEDEKLTPESSAFAPTKQEYTCEPPSTSPLHQTGKENQTSAHHPVQLGIGEKESNPAKLDTPSEIELAGRKRKLGSHRKSRLHQTPNGEEDNLTQKQHGRVSKTTTHEQADDIIRGPEESQSNIGDPKPSADSSKSVRNKTFEEGMPSRAHQEKVHLRQDTQNVSLGKANPYNVVMVGDSNVGKTSFMKRAQNGKFFPDLPASAGLDTCLWTVVVDGRPVVLQLWDTAGQERFRSITNQVFHRAHAFLLMYDITSSQSFTAVHYWARCIQEGSRENVPVLLLGNKSDHVERRVTTEEGQNVAKNLKADFMECSAVSGDNVIQSLEAVARLLSHKDDGRDETLVLHKAPPKKKAGCC